MNTRGTLWPSASTISGCVSAAWMTRPMRVRVSSSHSATSITSATTIMKKRVAGKRGAGHHGGLALHMSAGAAPQHQAQAVAGDCTSVKAGPCSRAAAEGHGRRPQISLHQFQHHVGQAEGDQQFGHVAELVHAAQRRALEQRRPAPHQQRRQHQRRPEAHGPEQL
jgi:hypothetical protein